MKKLLIPILSLLFIISLDSCQKDAVQQPEEEVGDTTRVVKLNVSYSNSSTTESLIFEYDRSGRIIKIKDSTDAANYFAISYDGNEATLTEVSPGNSNYSFTVRYKLNKDHLPIQRISAESYDDMGTTTPHYIIYRDTCKYEYDAAGLLVKATGAGYDSTWSSWPSIRIWTTHKVYTRNYTNNAGKLLSVKTNALEENSTTDGSTTLKGAIQTEENYSFEYNKNYPNKADIINAWVLAELDLLYSYEYPMIKYTNLPDKMTHTEKQTNIVTGDVNNTANDSHTFELEYLPSGYISTATDTRDDNYWYKYRFTYNK